MKQIFLYLFFSLLVYSGFAQDSIKITSGKYYPDIEKDEGCDKNGKYKAYYNNGKVKMEGYYHIYRLKRELVKDGKWVYYFMDGTIRLEEEYKKGALIGVKEYH